MTTLVHSYSNAYLGHITDDPNGGPIKTRCGRTLKNYSYGYAGMDDCPRCGSEGDFEVVRELMNEAYRIKEAKRLAENKRLDAIHKQRLTRHQEIMRQMVDILHDEFNLDGLQLHEYAAGGCIEFQVDGLKFKLRGGI